MPPSAPTPAAQSRITLNDIAEHAGVSRATVSLVLRNVPTVAADTRLRVQNSMRVLGYIYNRAAASLRTQCFRYCQSVLRRSDYRNRTPARPRRICHAPWQYLGGSEERRPGLADNARVSGSRVVDLPDLAAR